MEFLDAKLFKVLINTHTRDFSRQIIKHTHTNNFLTTSTFQPLAKILFNSWFGAKFCCWGRRLALALQSPFLPVWSVHPLDDSLKLSLHLITVPICLDFMSIYLNLWLQSVGQTVCHYIPVASVSLIYYYYACYLANATCTVTNVVTALIFIIDSRLHAFFLVVAAWSSLHVLVAVAVIPCFQHTPAVRSNDICLDRLSRFILTWQQSRFPLMFASFATCGTRNQSPLLNVRTNSSLSISCSSLLAGQFWFVSRLLSLIQHHHAGIPIEFPCRECMTCISAMRRNNFGVKHP